MDSPSEVDPWHLCGPTGRILGGFTQTSDFSLPLGTVVKDYVAEGIATSEGTPTGERNKLSPGSTVLRAEAAGRLHEPVPTESPSCVTATSF